MVATSSIIAQASQHVRQLFAERLAATLTYHNPQHTLDVVAAASEIAIGEGLSQGDQEILAVAAWFHDAGYTETYHGHEEVGAAMARTFLAGHGYPEQNIAAVERCILATKYPSHPQTMLESVLCDADLSHTGRKGYMDSADRLRAEWGVHLQKNYTEFEWLKNNLEFLTGHRFYTHYARNQFEERKKANLEKVQKRIHKLLEGEPEAALPATLVATLDSASKPSPAIPQPSVTPTEKPPKHHAKDHAKDQAQKPATSHPTKLSDEEKLQIEQEKLRLKEEKAKRPERGIETMFRITSQNHMNLSKMADDKASVLISINTLIISIVLSVLAAKLENNLYLIVPTLILLASSVTTIVFAVLSTRPQVSSGVFTADDVHQRRVNLLFFGNFYNVQLSDFDYGVREMMNDRDYLYGTMIKDIYFLGRVLGKKYILLRRGYTIFLYGIIISVLAFAVAFVVNALS